MERTQVPDASRHRRAVEWLARLWRDGPVEALRHEDGLRRDHPGGGQTPT